MDACVGAQHIPLAVCGLAAGGRPRSGVRRRLRCETALPEANSFLSECQPFCNIASGFFTRRGSLVTGVTFVSGDVQFGGGVTGLARFDPDNSRQYPRAVAHTWRYGRESVLESVRGAAPAKYARSMSLPTVLASSAVMTSMAVAGVGTRPNEERQPWPRASGLFSRTTAAGPVCTVSGCGCARVRVGRSCRHAGARVAVLSLRDSTQGLRRCFRPSTA